MTKEALHNDLLKAIRAVYRGEPYVLETLAASASAKSRPVLTPREVEILGLIVCGWRNKQIADELKMSDNTAKNHVKNILAKLGAQDRTQAATEAIRRGIIHLT